jgi:hypothetical protein
VKHRIIKSLVFTFITILILLSFYQHKEKKLKITKQNLYGSYGGNEKTENAYLGIYEDSIYYPDSDIWAKYKLKGDTIVVSNSDNSVEKLLILKLTTDSLVVKILNYDIENHLNRRKQ